MVPTGSFARTEKGIIATGEDNLAVITADAASGLVHVLVSAPADTESGASLVWRYADRSNHWRFSCSASGCHAVLHEQGKCHELASSTDWRLRTDAVNSLQVLDDGAMFGLYLNGALVFGRMFADARLQTAHGVGLHILQAQRTFSVQAFEAHPRTVSMPAPLRHGSPWLRRGEQVVVRDEFTGPAGELAGTATTTGEKIWRKALGPGQFMLTGTGAARVHATTQVPCPGRTAYTVGWDNPEFADLQVTITPPGTAKGQGERGRGGFILWQDPHNHITVSTWLDDNFDGTSISSFFHINGFEELYDAVWTNVGWRVRWGVPYRLRVVCDGMHYLVSVDGEPVLYRALSDVYPKTARLQIQRVGLVANWEWGNDTGSLFHDFVARF
jgi:hypothetical protein